MKGVPASLRRANEEVVVSYFLRHAEGTRAEIAKTTGLSAPTVGKIVDAMLKSEVLEERTPDSPGRAAGAGRPGVSIGLSSRKPAFVLVEIGKEETRVAAVPFSLSSGAIWEKRFRTGLRASYFFERLAGVARECPLDAPRAVLASMPGVVDEESGRVLFSPNLHWAEAVDWRRRLEATWQAPVELVQEVRALALGHASVSGADDFFLVDFGEGVGGAAVIAGQLQRGPLPLACEIGHVRVRGNPRACGCGGVGCLETLVSSSGLLESLRAHSRTRAHDDLGSLSRRLDDCLPDWLAEAIDETGIAIGGALNVLGLRTAIVTGVLPSLGPTVVARMREAVEQSSLWSRFQRIEVSAAPRAREPGLVLAGIRRSVLRGEGAD